MQRTRRHVVRGAVVTAFPALLAALLLVLTGAAPGATATASPGSGHHVTGVASAGTDSVPVVVPHTLRTQSLHRFDGPGPALLPDRAGSPRPTYDTGSAGTTAALPLSRTSGTSRGRAPPA